MRARGQAGIDGLSYAGQTARHQRRRISAVLYHDLRQDMRTACVHIMRAQGALPKSVAPGASSIQIIRPFNMPI
ncbi:hypothetical protein FJ938_18450 [Mesorhizobium sp. B2-4-14]|nr:hypothetical protein FJ938_18450 [Mesorhizobium sp. B2-4-14]